MPAFLQLVAQDLRQKFGADLSRVVVVFPNKRAELFINDYLLGDTALSHHQRPLPQLFGSCGQ